MPLVGVDPAKAFGAVGFLLENATLVDVVVVPIVVPTALGRIDTEQARKAIYKQMGICQLRAASLAPFGNKGFDLFGRSGHQVLVVMGWVRRQLAMSG